MKVTNIELLSFENLDVVLKNKIEIYDSGFVEIKGKQYTFITLQIDFLSIIKEENYNRYEDTDYTLLEVLFRDGDAFFRGLDMCTHISSFGDIEEQKGFIQKAFSQYIIKEELIHYFKSFKSASFEQPERGFFEWLKKGEFEIEILPSGY